MSEKTPSPLRRTREAFTRQAATFAQHAKHADPDLVARFHAALGPARSGRILDVACGPGEVTAAVAEGAASVVGLDATDAMLARARARTAGLANVALVPGDAEQLPFADATFDAVVTRLSLHHFTEPDRALAEIARVLRPGGRAVVVDVVTAGDADEAALQNAIERLRDPSHVRMLPPAELDRRIAAAGLRLVHTESWDMPREFEEWLRIVRDPARAEPLRVVARALAEAGRDAGFGLRVEGGELRFFHRWRLVAADRPDDGG